MFILLLEHAILHPECINKCKNKDSEMYEMGEKSFVFCCYENETYKSLLFCTMFKQGERFFLLSATRCGISRRQAHVRGVTRWEDLI